MYIVCDGSLLNHAWCARMLIDVELVRYRTVSSTYNHHYCRQSHHCMSSTKPRQDSRQSETMNHPQHGQSGISDIVFFLPRSFPCFYATDLYGMIQVLRHVTYYYAKYSTLLKFGDTKASSLIDSG